MIYLMQEFLNVLRVRKANQEKGQTLIEYALIIALIVIVVIAAMLLLGLQISILYNHITKILIRSQ
jgi:pilus assembly protein Flp/PilA